MEKSNFYGKKNKKNGDSAASKFSKDIKSLKDSFKISDILRNTKINNSLRIKAPKGTKIMTEKVIHEIKNLETIKVTPFNGDNNNNVGVPFGDKVNYECVKTDALNNIRSCDCEDESDEEEQPKSFIYIPIKTTPAEYPSEGVELGEGSNEQATTFTVLDSGKDMENPFAFNPDVEKLGVDRMESICEDGNDIPATLPRSRKDFNNIRKLSLDNTLLYRKPSVSKSESGLYMMGKDPLERKSSFLRKKFNSFVRNTSEVFKHQQSMVINRSSDARRHSLSQSLLSINDRFMQGVTSPGTHSKPHLSGLDEDRNHHREDFFTSSNSSLYHADNNSVTNSSMTSLNDPDEDNLNRAFSVSSGLDREKPQRSQSSRINRFTWLASESVADYLRRKIENHQDSKEKLSELHYSQSFQDISTLKVDSKGRRLSYQRAVSGEYPNSATRKVGDGRKRSKNFEDFFVLLKDLTMPDSTSPGGSFKDIAGHEVTAKLEEFAVNGIPLLKGFAFAEISDSAAHFLTWCESEDHLKSVCASTKLSSKEDARQSVIRELVNTEANYIRHLMTIVEVYIATAHALQDAGLMLTVETSKLFSNIPDVLNASLLFWEIAFNPMIIEAYENNTPYNPDLMWPGFCRFRNILHPYEKYVAEQSKCSDYLRNLSASDAEFSAYLKWCSSRNESKLQLADIMVKPMQRLTKYALIIRRIITLTDCSTESAPLLSMETFAKNYVGDVNRTITQKQAHDRMDELMGIVDGFELDFKDEEMDRLFRLHSGLNLHAPMTGCSPNHRRTILFEGALKFRDLKAQPLDAYAILLTDMLLICKKVTSKTSKYVYKLVRPKFIISKMLQYPLSHVKTNVDQGLYFVVTDEYGTSWTCFVISDPFKEPNPAYMRVWDQKIREAQLTYDMSYWLAKNPDRDLADLDLETEPFFSKKPYLQSNCEDSTIERDARETISTMLHKPFTPSTECDPSSAQSFDTSTSSKIQEKLPRPSTTESSRVSRISSLQQSTSATSNEDHVIQPGPIANIYQCGSSVEHLITPTNPDDEPTSITVNVLADSDPEGAPPPPPPPQRVAPPPPPRAAPTRASRSNARMLRIQPQCGVMALVHSLPDLSLENLRQRESLSAQHPTLTSTPMTASEKLYHSHRETLHKNKYAQRALTGTHLLSPNQRGTSYPPPTPTRVLSRSMAFSYTLKHPPLAKVGHVYSQSTNATAGEPLPSTSSECPPQYYGHQEKSIDSALPASTTFKTSDKSGDKKTKSLGSSSSGWQAKSTEA